MPSPWDYKPDWLQGRLREGLYFIALASADMQPLYDYSYMKGKFFSRVKNTRKAYFTPIAEKGEPVHFRDYPAARDALILIGKTPVANVPVGKYNLIVYKTIDGEPMVVLPYYVTKEVSNEQLASEQSTYGPRYEALQPEYPPLPSEGNVRRRKSDL